jgi:hypothetical protein
MAGSLATSYRPAWQAGKAETAAEGGAGRRSAKNAAAPLNQWREAHHPARSHHSPKGGCLTPGQYRTTDV